MSRDLIMKSVEYVMNKVPYTHSEINQLIDQLIEKVKVSHEKTWPYRFSVIVGIENGGLHISKPIAKALNLDHRTVKISHYHSDKLVIETNFFHVDLYDRGCLIVDDVFDTGRAAITFIQHCGELRPQDAFAGLFWKSRCAIKPEFYVKEVDAWITFPWET
jgi:hypoxanthine phosphoribosyltransferase